MQVLGLLLSMKETKMELLAVGLGSVPPRPRCCRDLGSELTDGRCVCHSTHQINKSKLLEIVCFKSNQDAMK